MKKVVTPRLRIHVNALWPFSAALPDGTALYIIHSALVFEKKSGIAKSDGNVDNTRVQHWVTSTETVGTGDPGRPP